jgi:hypothetical protein
MTSLYLWLKRNLFKYNKKPKVKMTNFQKYCQENPSAPECRIYDL